MRIVEIKPKRRKFLLGDQPARMFSVFTDSAKDNPLALLQEASRRRGGIRMGDRLKRNKAMRLVMLQIRDHFPLQNCWTVDAHYGVLDGAN